MKKIIICMLGSLLAATGFSQITLDFDVAAGFTGTNRLYAGSTMTLVFTVDGTGNVTLDASCASSDTNSVNTVDGWDGPVGTVADSGLFNSQFTLTAAGDRAGSSVNITMDGASGGVLGIQGENASKIDGAGLAAIESLNWTITDGEVELDVASFTYGNASAGSSDTMLVLGTITNTYDNVASTTDTIALTGMILDTGSELSFTQPSDSDGGLSLAGLSFTVTKVVVPPQTFTVNTIFQDKMVLQRDMDVPIWGSALPGTNITVKLDGVIVGTATADGSGEWMVRIGSHAHDGGVAHTIEVSAEGGAPVSFSDVVFGDVYLAAGQSNMDRTVNIVWGWDEEQASANYPLIREVSMKEELSTEHRDNPEFEDIWRICSPDTVASFSATAYFFAKNVYLETGVPIGILRASFGGKQILHFMAPEGVAAIPEMAGVRQQIQDEPGTGDSDGVYFDIYNPMIEPVVPYGICGFLWYQGEADSGHRDNRKVYHLKMRALIAGWREVWGLGDLPFYYVQIPTWDIRDGCYSTRESQLWAMTETNVGMVVTIDAGAFPSLEVSPGKFDDSLHPANKQDVGYRMAQWALRDIYGQSITPSGPIYKEAVVEGSQIRISFDYADGMFGGTKYVTNAVVPSAQPLDNFEIAGADRIYFAADAVIDGQTVVVSSTNVPSPLYVQYCYADWPDSNNVKLYNSASLPASPFRTGPLYGILKINSTSSDWHEAGTTMDLRGDNAPSGSVFNCWIGAASEVSSPSDQNTTMTVPARQAYMYASYRDVGESAYTLTVNQGGGDATAKANSYLMIQADDPQLGYRFNGWIGDTQVVHDVSAAVTTVTLPAANTTVTATYVQDGPIPNQAPEFDAGSIIEPNGVIDVAYTGSIADDASDYEGDPLTFSKVSGPTWLSVAANGALSGTPASTNLGANVFTVKVEDDEGLFDTAILNITIENEPDVTAPAAPTGLVASAGDGFVSLNWADNGEGDLAGYNVYRSTTSGSYGGAVATGVTTSDYTDNSVANGATFYYVVTAVDTSGNESGISNEGSATPQGVLWSSLSFDDFELGFGSYTDGGNHCDLYTNTTFAPQGNNALTVYRGGTDGDNAAFWTTNPMDLDTPEYTGLKIEFSAFGDGLDYDEELLIEYDDGSGWQTIGVLSAGVDVLNGVVSSHEVVINEGAYVFSSTVRIKFRATIGTNNNDEWYIDEINVSASSAGGSGPIGYDAWAVSNNITGGQLGDDDGDGLDNLSEYAVSEKPTFTKAVNAFTYVYKQRSDDPNLSYELQTCSDLVVGSWTNTGYTVTGTNVSGGVYDDVTNSIPVDGPQSYIRLKVMNE